jgi:hypothetical protein
MMNDEQPKHGRESSRRELIRTSAATAAVILLLAAVGFIGNQLHHIEEQLAFRAPAAPELPATLPAEVVAKGRVVYVPAYSHIYTNSGTAMLLATTLSVRNTDPQHPIRVDQVQYLDGDGNLVRALTEQPLLLRPMQTASFLIEQDDAAGGSGANFIVEWSAQKEINRPIIEAIMIGDAGLSFKSRGEPIGRY